MELSVKLPDIELQIEDSNVDFSEVITFNKINEVMMALLSALDVLRIYKKGMHMGHNKMLARIDENGRYLYHNGDCSADHDMDL